jgi:hypothetical protein
MHSQLAKLKIPKGPLALFILVVFGLLPAAARNQAAQVWSVASSTKIDDRITQQFQQLALDQHAQVQFLHKVPSQRADSPNLVFVLDAPLGSQALAEELGKEAGSSQFKVATNLAEEGYILHIDYSAASTPSRIQIETSSAKGLHLAILRVSDLLSTPASKLATELIPKPRTLRLAANGSEAVIADYPAFPMRGIVEGFYGKPWSHSDRVDVLRFEGQHRLNLYIYGPKDDPYHRKLWREPYPAEQLKHIGELAQVARQNFVDFSFAISPGLSMTYSSDTDFQALTQKLAAVRKLGITNFALFLDDVPQDLAHPEDKARFHSLAEAHSQLINRLYTYLKEISPDYKLTVCPTTYTNAWGSLDYIRELGAGVRSEIPIDWTGTEVIPPSITVKQAELWGINLQRKPLVWDNYPTDDGNNALLNLDPLRGREPLLFTAISGLISNPMNQAHASFIPLQTQSDYLWNPLEYDPQVSQRHTIVSQYGPDGPALLDPILDAFAEKGSDRPLFSSLFYETWAPIDVPKVEARITNLRTLVAALDGHPRFENLSADLKPIPDTLAAQLNLLKRSDAFERSPEGKIQWNRKRDEIGVAKIAAAPAFDGIFSKWEPGRAYVFNAESQIADGKELWKGPSQFSARIATAWDEKNLYFGIDIKDADLNQQPATRGSEVGTVRLVLDTTQPMANQFGRLPTVFDLYLSPGNFADLQPKIRCEEDLFPVRAQKHDYNREIHAVWKKTATGYSGDVVVPMAFFALQNFVEGQQFGLSFEVQKVLPATGPTGSQGRIVFSSKGNGPFEIDPESPTTLQQIKLLGPLQGPELGR